MAAAKAPPTLVEVLTALPDSLTGDRVTVGALLDALQGHGFVAALLVLAALGLLPLPVWSVVSAPVAVMCLHRLTRTGREAPPAWLLRRSLRRRAIVAACRFAVALLRRIEPVLRPRLAPLAGRPDDRFLTLVCAAMAALSVLPIPVVNWLPSIALFLVALGWFASDGLFVLAGIVFSAATIAAYIAVVVWLVGLAAAAS